MSVAGPTTTPNTDHVNSKYMYHYILILYLFILLEVLQSTGVKEATTYAGLIYYEGKGVEDLVTFAAARDLNALIEVSVSLQLLINVLWIYSSLKVISPELREDSMFIFVSKIMMDVLS